MNIAYFRRRHITIIGLYSYPYVECKHSESSKYYYMYLNMDPNMNRHPKYRNLIFKVRKWEI